jgi:hypothetical protein
VNPELYGAVMYMPGFSEEALIVTFSHLLDNKACQDDRSSPYPLTEDMACQALLHVGHPTWLLTDLFWSEGTSLLLSPFFCVGYFVKDRANWSCNTWLL